MFLSQMSILGTINFTFPFLILCNFYRGSLRVELQNIISKVSSDARRLYKKRRFAEVSKKQNESYDLYILLEKISNV